MNPPNHFKSRKFTFAFIGTGSVLGVFGASMATMVLCPGIAAQVVNLANIAIVFLGSVTGVMVTGQSFVDWRHGSASQFSSRDSKEEINETRTEKIEYTERTVRPRDFAGEDLE
jgi:hypothetical protein